VDNTTLANIGVILCMSCPAVVSAGICLLIWLQSRAALARINADLDRAQASAFDAQLTLWLSLVPTFTYRNEIEVEAKLLWALVTFAGYAPHQIALRVPVAVQVGRANANGQADWVLYADGRPCVVIEAKAPGQSLNGAVKAQARSYAYALNVPTYLLTNGHQIAIYRRGVQADQLILDCQISQIGNNWPAIAAAINPPDNSN